MTIAHSFFEDDLISLNTEGLEGTIIEIIQKLSNDLYPIGEKTWIYIVI